MDTEKDKNPVIPSGDCVSSARISPDYSTLKEALERLTEENSNLHREYSSAIQYLRDKVNQLLTVMGTSALRPEELDDKTLISTDPIGIISNSFIQILKHLRKTNEKLKISNQEINAIFNSAGAGILVIDKEMNTIAYNLKLKEHFFPDKTDNTGKPCYSLICDLHDPVSGCPFIGVFKTGEPVHLTGWVLKKHYFDVICTPIKDNSGEVSGAIIVYLDITDRIRMEEALRRSEEKYRDLFENATDLIQSVAPDGSILYVNRAWRETLGYSEQEVPDLSIFDIIHPECTECGPHFKSIVFGQNSGRVETIFITKEGKKIIVEGNVNTVFEGGSLRGTRGIFRDITEKRTIEEKLLKAEKIESLGVLAGGIAHDFNNLLSAIMANIELAAMELGPGNEALESLSHAEKAVMRAADLTQQLLTFSKGGAPIKKTASIIELLRDSADFVLSGSYTRCSLNLSEDLWQVEVDPGQICQVINNILLNAVHAMPEGGQILVNGRNTVIGNGHPELKEGRYVKVSIQDAGRGIPKEHLQRIFEPYFTTKNGGSGLGLATSYSIIKKHSGLIEVASEPGKGTCFTLYLPSVSGAVAHTPDPAGKLSMEKSGGKVLLMDDDEMIRLAVGEMLKQIGYEVVLATEGKEALEEYETAKISGAPFDAVILDLTIPGGMGGKETIKKLIELDPGVKAIVSSGYSGDAIMANHRHYGFSGILAKPYQMKDLAAVLRDVLAQ